MRNPQFKFHDWIGQFENSLRDKGNSPKTIEKYDRFIWCFLNQSPEKKHPEEFFRSDIEDFRRVCLKEGKKPAYINNSIRAVGAFWNWLSKVYDKPLINPASSVTPLETPRDRREPAYALTYDEAERLINASEPPYERLYILLALTTGLHPYRLLRLTWRDVETLPNLRLDVKTLLDDLRSHYTGCLDFPVFRPWLRNRATLAVHLCQVASKAGLDNPKSLHPSVLRRTFVTLSLKAGAGVDDLAEHLNMKNRQAVLNYSGFRKEKALVDILNLLPAASPQA